MEHATHRAVDTLQKTITYSEAAVTAQEAAGTVSYYYGM